METQLNVIFLFQILSKKYESLHIQKLLLFLSKILPFSKQPSKLQKETFVNKIDSV